jgi:hypothetical protein
LPEPATSEPTGLFPTGSWQRQAWPRRLVATGCSSWCSGGGGGRSGSGSRCSNGSAAFGVDNGDHFVSNHGAAVALDDLHQHASGRRWQFQNHFVGFDIDQVFVARDGSPTFLCQVSMVASATDSDSWGTLTSICAM